MAEKSSSQNILIGLALVMVVAAFAVTLMTRSTGQVTAPAPVAQPSALPEIITIVEPFIDVTDAPLAVKAGDSFAVAWNVNGNPQAIRHTAVHYGPASLAPQTPSDYPKASQFLCVDAPCQIPGEFSVQLTIAEPGKYYYRAHAVVDGKNIWSAERSVSVIVPFQSAAPLPETDYVLEADDNGFYSGIERISSLRVTAGETISIRFDVRRENVYFGGLDFRGCGKNVTAPPDNSAVLEFTANAACSITSYWPVTDIKKETLEIAPFSAGGY